MYLQTEIARRRLLNLMSGGLVTASRPISARAQLLSPPKARGTHPNLIFSSPTNAGRMR